MASSAARSPPSLIHKRVKQRRSKKLNRQPYLLPARRSENQDTTKTKSTPSKSSDKPTNRLFDRGFRPDVVLEPGFAFTGPDRHGSLPGDENSLGHGQLRTPDTAKLNTNGSGLPRNLKRGIAPFGSGFRPRRHRVFATSKHQFDEIHTS